MRKRFIKRITKEDLDILKNLKMFSHLDYQIDHIFRGRESFSLIRTKRYGASSIYGAGSIIMDFSWDLGSGYGIGFDKFWKVLSKAEQEDLLYHLDLFE